MLATVDRIYALSRPRIPHGPIDALWPRGLTLLGSFALRHFPDHAVEALAPLQASLAAAAIPLAYLGLRRFIGHRPALWAAWLLAVDPLAVGIASFFVPEGYALFLLAAALAFLRPERPLALLAAGLALGAASLFAPEALLLVLLWPLAVRHRRSILALAAGAALVVVPEVVSLSLAHRRPVPLATGGGLAFYASQCEVRPVGRFDPLAPPMAMEPFAPGSALWPVVSVKAPLDHEAPWLREGLRCLAASPRHAVVHASRELADLFAGWPFSVADAWPLDADEHFPWQRAGNLAVAFLLLPLALNGAWRRRRDAAAWLSFGLPLVALATTAVVFGGSPQRRIPFEPFLLGGAAWTMAALWDGAPGRKLREFLARPQALALAGPPAAEARGMKTFLCALVLAALAFAACAPLARAYWFSSHEGDAYLLRLFEWLRDLRSGNVVPRWADDLYGGYGAPHFDFFAPGVFLAGAPLVLAGLPLDLAMKGVVVLATLGGAAGAFLLARGETGRDDAALVASAAFVFTPYRFVDLFLRGDLAEHAALCALPIALWLYRELFRCRPGRRALVATGAAAAHAAVLLSHTITGQWGTELIVAVAAVSALPTWSRGDRAPVKAAVVAMAGAFGLAAFYVVPALLEKRFAHLEVLTAGYYTAIDHLVPARLFFRFGYFDFTTDGSVRDPHAVRMPFTIGLPLFGAMILAVGCLAFRRTRARLAPGLLWWALVAALLFVMTPAAEPLWPALPLASYMGFPWRLLALVASTGAAAIAVTWAAAIPPAWRGRLVLALGAAGAIAATSARFVKLDPLARPAQPIDATYVQRLVTPLCSGEHLPRAAAFVPTAPRSRLAVPVGPAAVLRADQPAAGRYRFETQTPAPADIDAQVFWFPGWRLLPLSGPALPALWPSPRGLVRIHLPAAGRYSFELRFGHTPVRAAAEVASLLTLLLLWPVARRLLRPRAVL